MKTFRNILFIYLEISLLMNLIFYSLCDLLNFDMQIMYFMNMFYYLISYFVFYKLDNKIKYKVENEKENKNEN